MVDNGGGRPNSVADAAVGYDFEEHGTDAPVVWGGAIAVEYRGSTNSQCRHCLSAAARPLSFCWFELLGLEPAEIEPPRQCG